MGGTDVAGMELAGTEEAGIEEAGMEDATEEEVCVDEEDSGVDCICGGSEVLSLSRMAKVNATIRVADKTKINKRKVLAFKKRTSFFVILPQDTAECKTKPSRKIPGRFAFYDRRLMV